VHFSQGILQGKEEVLEGVDPDYRDYREAIKPGKLFS